MKKTGNYVRYFILLISSIVLITSCEPDENDAGGKLSGSWTCKETVGSKSSSFTVQITSSLLDDSEIKINNFNNLGITVSAELNGLSLTIPNQSVDGFDISGSGTVASNYNTINCSYSVYDGAETEQATAVFTKK